MKQILRFKIPWWRCACAGCVGVVAGVWWRNRGRVALRGGDACRGRGAVKGCERRGLSASLLGWGSGGSWVRWCLGLECRGGAPGGGSPVLMGRARGSVLLDGHGRV